VHVPNFEVAAGALSSKEDADSGKRSARKEQKMMNDIEAQTYVLKQGAPYWKSILDWDTSVVVLKPSEVDVLKIATLMPRKLPQPFQCQKLLIIEEQARKEGFRPGAH
jgi:hypothetical protein